MPTDCGSYTITDVYHGSYSIVVINNLMQRRRELFTMLKEAAGACDKYTIRLIADREFTDMAPNEIPVMHTIMFYIRQIDNLEEELRFWRSLIVIKIAALDAAA